MDDRVPEQVETLKTFCDLVESGSFTRAAELNYVSQSAVSQQVRALEQRFERRLLERGGGHSVEPTEAGKLVYAESRASLDRLRALGATGVRELDGKPEDMVFALPKELRLTLVD
jgi:DNA-binding transcriptional LysR family regulator